MYILQYLIRVTDNSLLLAVASALLCATLARARTDNDRPSLLWGLLLGFIPALIYAILKRTTGIAVREYYNLGVLFVSLTATSLLTLTYLVDCIRSVEGRGRFYRWISLFTFASWMAYILPNIFLYPFEFSVGMDSIFNSDYMDKVTGYSVGILLILTAALTLYAVVRRLPKVFFVIAFLVSNITVLVFQVMTVGQVLLGRNLIPRHDWLMQPVMWGLTHGSWFWFAPMLVAGVVAVISFLLKKRSIPSGDNPAQIRKSKYVRRRLIRLSIALFLYMIATALIMTVGQEAATKKVVLSPAVDVPVGADGNIHIPLSDVNDGNLHRFSYIASDGTAMRYIIIKKSERAYGVALDACDICGASGYYQRKHQIVCILCDVPINITTIGFHGGCNPVPFPYKLEKDEITIDPDELEKERSRFQ